MPRKKKTSNIMKMLDRFGVDFAKAKDMTPAEEAKADAEEAAKARKKPKLTTKPLPKPSFGKQTAQNILQRKLAEKELLEATGGAVERKKKKKK